MESMTWVMWGVGAAGYAAMLLLTSQAERRFMDDPTRWTSNGRAIAAPPTARLPRATFAQRLGCDDHRASELVREVA